MTLAGPGGVGKTRLAVELLAAPSSRAGAVWFVELATVSADADVATTVARALQLAGSPGHEIDLVCDYLSRRSGLLVLDTCEHVVEGAAELTTVVLARCADLQVLTTTREPLRTPGESGRSTCWGVTFARMTRDTSRCGPSSAGATTCSK